MSRIPSIHHIRPSAKVGRRRLEYTRERESCGDWQTAAPPDNRLLHHRACVLGAAKPSADKTGSFSAYALARSWRTDDDFVAFVTNGKGTLEGSRRRGPEKQPTDTSAVFEYSLQLLDRCRLFCSPVGGHERRTRRTRNNCVSRSYQRRNT